ncbi:alginate lyase family protein [Actinocrispum sp. NPDC049592]|uniref:alginate lyase family protein n=1 Tax=Actinocrispum sp. NPDC049592 TaxID=3154835 RepID=UPI0034348665
MLPLSSFRRAVGVFLTVGTMLVVSTASPASAAPTSDQTANSLCSLPVLSQLCPPRTAVLDGDRLARNRIGLLFGDRALRTSLNDLLVQANAALTKGPWSVMDKTQVPPSGDRHDYLSLAPYYWPTKPQTPDNPQGCPYVNKDGVRNPATDAIPDKASRLTAFTAIYQLTLAWYYTGDAKYAKRAALDLRTWFLDPATKMNPNMNFAQGIPCQTDGRGIGIIEFSYTFTQVLDAAAILNTGAPGWTRNDDATMKAWSKEFLTWLQTSKNGKDEAGQQNNHGTFLDMLMGGIAIYTGQQQVAKDIVEKAKTNRLDKQIAADGSQPMEATRTRSYHYFTFNLVALTRLAQVAKHVGIDLWSYQTPQGGSLVKAVDFILPAATGGQSFWPYQELNFLQYAAKDSVHAAADAGDKAAKAALPKVPAPPGGDLYPVRPAAEQLDDISITG